MLLTRGRIHKPALRLPYLQQKEGNARKYPGHFQHKIWYRRSIFELMHELLCRPYDLSSAETEYGTLFHKTHREASVEKNAVIARAIKKRPRLSAKLVILHGANRT